MTSLSLQENCQKTLNSLISSALGNFLKGIISLQFKKQNKTLTIKKIYFFTNKFILKYMEMVPSRNFPGYNPLRAPPQRPQRYILIIGSLQPHTSLLLRKLIPLWFPSAILLILFLVCQLCLIYCAIYYTLYQCCGPRAGGAEIIWDLEAELEPKLSF